MIHTVGEKEGLKNMLIIITEVLEKYATQTNLNLPFLSSAN
jgi:hypothetical protein